MKRSKVLLTLLCAAALVVTSVFGTMAYLTDNETATNTFTVGLVDITLDEAPVGEDGKEIAGDRVTKNEYHLLPGHTYDKDPTVTVEAPSEDAYVRMLVTINKSAEWDAICDTHKDQQGNNLFGAEDMFVNLSADWELKGNTEDTVANTRTYEFWYKEKVEKNTEGKDTVLNPLFEKLYMPGALTNADLEKLGDDFEISVEAHAIQADGFATAELAWDAFDPALDGYDQPVNP